jgi:hypothetical protein
MFSSQQYLPEAVIARLVETRIADPEFSLRAAGARVRRPNLAPTGRLNILAADHPARRVTKSGRDPLGMADRRDYLARILRVLECHLVDGVMATMDVLEDLLALDAFGKMAPSAPLLDGKVLIASLNRGGLAGASWELDDPISGATPATCAQWSLDGANLMLRIADQDAGSLKTLLATSRAITEANALGLPTFLEPLPMEHIPGSWAIVKTKEALARIAGVASALGDSSRRLWLKLPYCEGFQTVTRATTLPILLLGGESAGDPPKFLSELAQGLACSPTVRGALVGRTVLYPGAADPLPVAEAAGRIIHQGWSVAEALAALSSTQSQESRS